jgi:hypothetical protein
MFDRLLEKKKRKRICKGWRTFSNLSKVDISNQ